MKCAEYVEWIAEMLDGSLPPDRAEELRGHLARCARCRAEVVLQKSLDEALAAAPVRDLAPGFAEAVSERAFRRARAEKWADRITNVLPMAGLLVGAFVVFHFRVDLARLLPALADTARSILASPLSWVGDQMFRFAAGAADLPKEHIPTLERISRPLMMTIVAAAAGVIPTVWAFARMFAFLKD